MTITQFKPNPGLNPSALPEWRKLTRAVNELERHRTIVTGKIASQSRTAGATLQRISTAVADVSGGSTDTRAGNAPTGLAATVTGYYDGVTGNPSTQVVLTWTAPTTYTDGSAYTASGYEIWRLLSGGEWQFHGQVSGTTATLLRQPFAGSTYQYEVRAQSADNGLYSAFSSPVTVTPPTTLAALPAPGAPTLATSFGYVTARWDGQIAGATPPAGFRGVYAETATSSSGPWTAGGQNLLSAGATALGPFSAGTVMYVRLRGIDALGQAGTAGTSASITVVGLDSASSTAISNAQSTANTALTTANGKNQITRSTAAASGSGITTGDMWWQVDGTGAVIASWSWQGSAWVSQTLSSTFIPNLDAGKITTGFLSAARIATGTISASQLLIADFTNLFENPAMDVSIADPTLPRGITSVAGGHGYTGTSWYLSAASGFNNDSYAPGLIPVNPGDQFFVSADMYFAAATGTTGQGRVGFRFLQADKTTIVTWVVGASTSTPNSAGATTKATYSGTATVPANSAYAQIWFTFSDNGETTNKAYFSNVIVNRRANANLIVDGSITTAKIATGQITSSLISTTGLVGITITGSTIQTLATASRGIKLSGTTLQAFDGSGNATLTVDGSTGAVTAVGLNATTATISGAITATSGSITGTMLVTGTLATGTTGARVAITSAGLTGFNSAGTATFQFLTSSGTLTATGGTFTGVTVSGNITATTGTVSGTLTIGSVGKITSSQTYSGGNSSATFDSTGLSATTHTNSTVIGGTTFPASDQSVTFGADRIIFSETFSGATHTEISIGSNADNSGGTISANNSTLNGTLTLYGAGTAELHLTDDGSPRIWSNAILNRSYPQASSNGVSSSNLFAVVTSAGTIGTLTGGIFLPDVYTRVRTTRAMMIQSDGSMGTTASSRRVKKNIKPLRWDGATVKRWLDIKPVEFEYRKEHGVEGQHHGFIAEDVHDAGFEKMVYYDDVPGTKTPGRIDGFAYERMGVYDHIALGALYDELMSLRQRVADLEGA